MKYVKLNKNWNSEPNTPEAEVLKTDDGIALTFLLNALIFQHIDEHDKGSIYFFNVYVYRLGSTNDEGYFNCDFRFKKEQLPWGEFYELFNSNWKHNFPDEKVILDDSINKNKLRHFIFFLKDQTFECLALDYKFSFLEKVSEALEVKYPKGYLNHYLALFTSQFKKPTLENYKMYTDLYIQMEGKKEFIDLKSELKIIKMNNDLNFYLKVINNYEIANFGIEQLNEMVKVIETFKIDHK